VKLVFWACLGVIALGYAGYPIYLWCRARFLPRPVVRKEGLLPSVSVILAARNEGKHLPRKLRNLDELKYPKDLLQIVAISDGSTDETNEILRGWQGPDREAILLRDHRGKPTALNHGIDRARGEIVCFVDVAQMIEPDGLRMLMEPFGDPSVGCVSGALVSPAKAKDVASHGVGMYWRLETHIRQWESLTGSTAGATGAFYAVRKSALSHIPDSTILDDMYVPLKVANSGLRVVFEPRAQTVETRIFGGRDEFRRKVRTLTGNYQLLKLAPWILMRANPARLRFVCHKLIRLLVPFALAGLFLSAFSIHERTYQMVFALQAIFYALAALTTFRMKFGFLSRAASVSLAFLILNTAAAVAFLYFILGKTPAWAD
jgi:cellulose synthase/poly-beta-1,6-N-acetylglucosamine synthase-like glycosyltransferase